MGGQIKRNPKVYYALIKNKAIGEKIKLVRVKGGNVCLELGDVGEKPNEYFALVFTKERSWRIV